MKEKPKRLTPKPKTIRELFLKSGNLCAFPNCPSLMMDEKGVFIGQLCHIEAAEPGGERFRPDMTNEQRRSVGNLMLMCYPHHQVTNNVSEYPVPRMKKMKAEHEQRFSSPDRAILERLTDWTTVEQPTGVSNLGRLNDVMDWNQGESELSVSVKELNRFIEKLHRVPIEVRRFVGKIAARMHRMRKTSAVLDESSGTNILISDVKDAFRISDSTIKSRLAQIDSYGLGGLDQIDTDVGPQPAICIYTLESGWPIWLEIVAFCEKTDAPIERFTDDLDFSDFDS
jgi:hypothetical protein